MQMLNKGIVMRLLKLKKNFEAKHERGKCDLKDQMKTKRDKKVKVNKT